jgi:macrolide-specific efflux system membrane fusion protein
MSVLSDLAGRLPRRAAPAVRTTNIVLLALVAGLGVAAYLALRTTASVATAAPRTSPVAHGVVLSSVSASGTVQAATNLSVGFQTSGRVTAVDVKPGQRVTKGQVLGRLDSTDATAAVKEAEANLATANANLAQARAGETAQQKTADALSLTQSKAQVTQAETALKNAQAQLKTDDTATGQSVALAKSTATVTQSQKQLKADQGNLAAAVAKLKADKAKLTINGTTYANPDDAVNAMTNVVNQDKAQQQGDVQTNYDLQAQQTTDQQQLASDQAAQKTASTPADQSFWQGKVNDDQAKVNADALKVQQMAKDLNAIQYQLTQDQAALQTLQTLQSTITQDTSSIQSYESKIVADNNGIASAKSQRTSQIQSAQSARTSTLAKDQQAIVQAQQQVSAAKLAVTSTAANNTVKSTTPPATLAQDSAQVLQAQVGLASARLTLEQTVLRAPVAGTVSSVGGVLGQSVSGGGTSANSSSTSSTSSTGSSAGGSTSTSTSSSSSAFVSLVDLRGLEVTASFSETDAAKIQLGQAGTITVSALPNKELAAHVVSMDTSGTSSSGVVTYTVTMALDRTIAGLKPGMSANATVTTSERDNVLNVPNAAVTGSGSTATVKVLKNGVQSTVTVVAGLKGDSTTEVVSGLTAGQQVVTSSGVVATTGTAGAAAGAGRAGGGAGFPGGGGGGFPGGGGGAPRGG